MCASRTLSLLTHLHIIGYVDMWSCQTTLSIHVPEVWQYVGILCDADIYSINVVLLIHWWRGWLEALFTQRSQKCSVVIHLICVFRTLLSDSTHQLKSMSKKLGGCIEKARPYYEALDQYQKVRLQSRAQLELGLFWVTFMTPKSFIATVMRDISPPAF